MDGAQYVANVARFIASNERKLVSATLSLTPHHLYYLLCRLEELGVDVGDMSIRLPSANSYSSFQGKKDPDSISVRSVSSVQSGISALWKVLAPKQNETVALRYLYSCFTKLPNLKLTPDSSAESIQGWEEFPFDTAVPLSIFKNLTELNIVDLPIHAFYGWDIVAERVRCLALKRCSIEDVGDILTSIILEDMERRLRRRPLSRAGSRGSRNGASPQTSQFELSRDSPSEMIRETKDSRIDDGRQLHRNLSTSSHQSISPSRRRSSSEARPASARRFSQPTRARHDSTSSSSSITPMLPATKWRLLRHLSLADNSLTCISNINLAFLTSLDLSSNLLTSLPDLSLLPSLGALDVSNNMIDTLSLLTPLPAIKTLLLRGNRLKSLYGLERFIAIVRLDVRDNGVMDPHELGRAAKAPGIKELWVTGNPFTRNFSNYRVIIFNIYRSTPGRECDIVIDSTGPGVFERRSLSPFMPLAMTIVKDVSEVKGEGELLSLGKKKGRRVQISRVEPPEWRRVEVNSANPGNQSSEGKYTDYRQRIENLRDEVGDNWLSVLSEEESNERANESRDRTQ